MTPEDRLRILCKAAELEQSISDCRFWMGEYLNRPEDYQKMLTLLNAKVEEYRAFITTYEIYNEETKDNDRS